MLNQISWANYLLFIVIVLLGYYLTIGIIYYKAELKNILSGNYRISGVFRRSKTPALIKQKKHSNEPLNENALFQLVNQLSGEIKSSLAWAAENNLIKQEVIFLLQRIAKKYTELKGSSYQAFINNYIIGESSNYGSVQLSEDDVNVIWAI